MNHNIYIYIIIMGAVSYAIRALPLTLLQKQVENRFFQSFLYYVPYVTLSVMTFPAIIEATMSPVSGAAALIIGIAGAWLGAGLFKVALSCCGVVLITELILL